MSAIVCDALTRDFGELRALDRLTLSVPEGSIFAFLGPNGAGKTTTIHLLLGITEPTSGSSRVLGFDPVADGYDVRRSSGALLEHSGLYERLTAADNLRFYARIAHLTPEETDERMRELLTRFGLYERRDDVVGTWSRGMKQKLAIARALIHRPSLVFLDEPTAGLDPEATVALRKDIAALGTTVFLTTHNLADVEKMATHVAVIRQGQLLDFGTPAELRRRAIRSHVTIRMKDRAPLLLDVGGDESVAPLVTKLVHEGAQIEEVRREEPSLEAVFLYIVKSGTSVEVRGTSEGRDDSNSSLVPRPLSLPREPLFRDIATIVRKEWREITASAGSGVTSRTNLIVAALLLAVVAGFSAMIGPPLIDSPAVNIVALIAYLILIAAVVDSFPGERERHTLETLLASSIPDEALVIGKILASVLYGWFTVLTLLVVALIAVNIRTPGVMYPLSTILGLGVLTPLVLLFLSSAGVLLAMRIPTVRAAQPRLMGGFMVIFIVLVLVMKFVPQGVRMQTKTLLSSESGRIGAFFAQIVFFVALDVAILTFAVMRFRRSRLI
jgi:ABC-2 type transport system ATP-binding protein